MERYLRQLEAALRRRGLALADAARRTSAAGRAGILTASRTGRFLGSELGEAFELRLLSRTLLHAGLVGLVAGVAGVVFFGLLEGTQRWLLEGLAGYTPLRAAGEGGGGHHGQFRPWLLMALPAVGGLVCGLLLRLAPEAAGGGGNSIIEAFHHRAGFVRRRVPWVKAAASIATLGTGGAGGREGPTMQIGGAVGSLLSRVLRVSARERRILVVAGLAAGISAVFRTPLGAALIAVEILYRDGFESDALVPAILASVVAYAVAVPLFGEVPMFAHARSFPLVLWHLPLYGLLAVAVSGAAKLFLVVLRRSHAIFARLPVAIWARPAVGGLFLGVLTLPLVLIASRVTGHEGQGLGVLGGGYGAVQMAATGTEWFPQGWDAVALLVFLAVAKIVATSLTIGSGGSAGDFAPSLGIGGLIGGAFGRAIELVANVDVDPAAFALVGMGAFYGGVAHVPLASVVLVCELAGNYDLLVPLMLAQGISLVLLRRDTLYSAQVPTPRDSVFHKVLGGAVLHGIPVSRILERSRTEMVELKPSSTMTEMIVLAKGSTQPLFLVRDDKGAYVGMVPREAIMCASGDEIHTKAFDLMTPPATLAEDASVEEAVAALSAYGVPALPVGTEEQILGFITTEDISSSIARAVEGAGLRADVKATEGQTPS